MSGRARWPLRDSCPAGWPGRLAPGQAASGARLGLSLLLHAWRVRRGPLPLQDCVTEVMGCGGRGACGRATWSARMGVRARGGTGHGAVSMSLRISLRDGNLTGVGSAAPTLGATPACVRVVVVAAVAVRAPCG